MANPERGSMMPLLGALAFTAIVVLFLAVEIGRFGGAWRTAAFAADAGAAAAAAEIDRASAYEGTLALDEHTAATLGIAEAMATAPRPGRTATASTTTRQVCITVTQPHDPSLLRSVGILEETITVTACAGPREG